MTCHTEAEVFKYKHWPALDPKIFCSVRSTPVMLLLLQHYYLPATPTARVDNNHQLSRLRASSPASNALQALQPSFCFRFTSASEWWALLQVPECIMKTKNRPFRADAGSKTMMRQSDTVTHAGMANCN
jgi:hypothetical protein